MSAAAWEQIALMVAEAVFVAALLLAAYRLRDVFGLSLVHIILGVIFQYSALLAAGVYVQLTPWLVVSPGSVVLFPAVLFLVIFVYVSSDAVEARKLIYAVAGANVVFLPFAFVVSVQLMSPIIINPTHLAPGLFSIQPRIVIPSAVILYLDTLLVCLCYEVASRMTRSITLRVLFALLVTLYFDSVAFVSAAFGGSPGFVDIMLSQLAGKTVAAVVYAIVLALYLRYFGTAESLVLGNGRKIGAIFRVLTYRQRYEELQRVVERDALTHVYSRRFFDDALEKYVELSRRSGLPLALMMIDADNFKRVNDQYGHTEGDRVLRLIAQSLVASLRVSDHVCRYGGEEFAILLPQTELAQAIVLAERVVADVPPGCANDWHGSTETIVTVTAGVAAYPHEAADGADLVRIADRRLYEGKAAGRNRVVARG